MFYIQQTATEVMVWSKSIHDGRQICVFIGKHRYEASLWIENAMTKLKAKGYIE